MSEQKKGRGRPRSGTVYEHGDHFDVRVTLPGGKRSPTRCLEPGTSLERAKEIARAMTERAEERAAVPVVEKPAVPSAETFAAWAERWCIERERRGNTTVGDDRGRLRKWINPTLGTKPMTGEARIDRDDLEALVEVLDEAVLAGELSWKTAANAWGLVTKAFSDASHSKTKVLRVRADNPADGVPGPDRGIQKSKAYLWPTEFGTLVSCPAVPAQWRRVYVVATYLYLRAAELRALEWTDIDLAAGVVLVHQTEDGDGAMDSTKAQRARRFNVEPTLLPMLRAMHAACDGVGRVFPQMPTEKHLAPMLRRHLEAAGVTRVDLHVGDATRRRVRFHDLRATGITWMAIRGDDPLKIKARAGHRTFSTTEGYIREAEAVRDGFGVVFPAPPTALFSSGFSSEKIGANGHAYQTKAILRSGRRDLNPAPDASAAHDPASFADDSRVSPAATAPEVSAADAVKYADDGPLTKTSDDITCPGWLDRAKRRAVGARSADEAVVSAFADAVALAHDRAGDPAGFDAMVPVLERIAGLARGR